MSVLTRTRFLIALVLALSAHGLFAAFPSPRTSVRMAYDPVTTYLVLFGGETAFDRGTSRAYQLDETWLWTGSRWMQRFLPVTPGARAGHVMVTDERNRRIILFGGRQAATDLNDTWSYENGSWAKVDTPNAPSARYAAAAAYDSTRGRIVLFGGNKTTISGSTVAPTPQYDTWEFDGGTWIQRSTTGPELLQPTLAYHAALDQMILVGTTKDAAVKTYRYDPAAGTWNELAPANKPTCATDATVTYNPNEQKLILTGGLCTVSQLTDEVWKWDGTDWAKVDTTTKVDRIYSFAQAFDPVRGVLTRYGGTAAFDLPRDATWTLGEDWSRKFITNAPGPRSLFALAVDPNSKTTYMYGGLLNSDFLYDFWKYQNGRWQFIPNDKTPASCTNANGAFDTDRNRFVVLCGDGTTFEWDGSAWLEFPNASKPPYRRFSAMVYDPTLKRTVMFGGFDDVNYVNRTWLWDGTNWSEQKSKRPTARGLHSMWFDPVLKKTVFFGGVGRPTPDDGVERYSDMWSLDSSGWTKMTPASTPGMRYGAQTVVDTANNRVLLFGGLLYEEQTTPTLIRKQTFQNDLWSWNGQAWQKLATTNAPPARQNGALFIDPSRNETVIFGGYGGSYFSDTWVLSGDTWKPFQESTGRRRTLRPGTTVSGTVFDSSPEAFRTN